MLTIRIRSSNGTRRLVVDETDILSALSPRIQTEFAAELTGKTFRLWREGDASRQNLISGVDGGRSFRDVGLRQGEMLYLEATAGKPQTNPIPQPQSTSFAGASLSEIVVRNLTSAPIAAKSAWAAPLSQGVESFPLGHVAIYRKIRELFS
ncbi:hypothetical protein QFC21_005778 [Naganishia friedmannii]|uniref:Uncharacterized protein n=1 Tax=Naganishia friedmannii TaxID=89922 RepID=A0ACC2V774_9TREE|nr:hypothetical protein QFC21_005778 [Naganishia friedmannii]